MGGRSNCNTEELEKKKLHPAKPKPGSSGTPD